MTKTNGLKILSDPWIYPEEKANALTAKAANESPPGSPIFRTKKKTMNNLGIFSQNVNNPEEIDLDPMPSFGHKTGMQALLSDVIDSKSKMAHVPKRNNEFLSSLGMRAM